jgi:hypothetical protein
VATFIVIEVVGLAIGNDQQQSALSRLG